MSVLDFFFPKRCIGCNKLRTYFCDECVGSIRWLKNQICPICGKEGICGLTHPKCKKRLGLDGMIAPFYFTGIVKDAIHRIKYQLVSDLTSDLVSIAYADEKQFFPRIDLLTPVPLHMHRLRVRGFNQSLFIAKTIGEIKHVSVYDHVLHRVQKTKPQAELTLNDRKGNVYNVFKHDGKTSVRGKHIGVVDDVATTRSTLSECAKVLKKAGAVSVWGIVLAYS